MNLSQKLQERIIRLFFHPFQLKKAVNFKDTIQHVRQILIYCPEFALLDDMDQHLKKLFKNASIHYLLPIQKVSPIHSHIKTTHIHYVNTNSVAKIQLSKQYQTFMEHPVDLFIDLDIEPNLLNIFLCRLLHPTICLTYYKAYGEYYYNLQYRTNTYHPTPERFKNIHKILSLWMTK